MEVWAAREDPDRWAALDGAALVFSVRNSRRQPSRFDGDLSELADPFAEEYGPQKGWSGSRLETYRLCPYSFFVRYVLGLEPREEPREGLDGRQLGNIYHRILEMLYKEAADASDTEALLAALDQVAGRILDEAPRREGFRVTAWWEHTRGEITDHVRDSLRALAELGGEYVPYRFEAPFGLHGHPPLVIREGEDRLRLRGFIDRVDRDAQGWLRIIDYKAGGPWGFDKKAVVEGKKLQLPLYGLAARDALGLGEPAEGFYWHVQQAEASGFKMSTFDGGPNAAMELGVLKGWEAVHGVRAARFAPQPPPLPDGCPSYCPAVAFCWHYRPGYRR